MRLLRFFQDYFRRQSLRQKLAALQKWPRQGMNFAQAQSVGLLFDATDPAKRSVALQYADQLRQLGKKVKMLGFFDSKQEGPALGFDLFSRKNLDWAERPNGQHIEHFLQQTYDILITLNPLTHPPTEYLVSLTRAHLKVGPVTPHADCYDLMIDTRNKNSVNDFIQEMENLFRVTNTQHGAQSA